MSVLALQIEKPYWQDVMLQLVKNGVQITAAVTHYRDVKSPNQFFATRNIKQIPGKKFYRIEDLSKLLINDFGSVYPALSREVIESFQKVERDYYNLTDRFSYFPKPFRYRKRLFRESLRYWLAFFERNKITHLFTSCTPHNLADYTAYHVAKYLNIPIIQTAHTMINDHVLIRNDYREEEKIPANFLPNASEEEVKAKIEPQLCESAMAECKVLQIVISQNDASQKNKALNTKPVKKKKDLKHYMKRLCRKSPKFKMALAMNGVYPPIVRRVFKLNDIIFQKIQRHKHDALAITPNLDEKYIYFAMHLQPERTSTPEAEVFEDHLMAIENLSKALPEGWKLYVKENPRQFDKINYIKGRHMRDVTDYNDFLKFPNVKLISQDVPSKDLVGKAQIVSTLSGSVGWEAIRAGKPVITFANAWYGACESVYRVNNIEEAKAAIEAAQTSTPEKVHLNILRYLAFIQPHLSIGNMGQNTYLRASNMPYEVIVNKMAERLQAELKSQGQPGEYSLQQAARK